MPSIRSLTTNPQSLSYSKFAVTFVSSDLIKNSAKESEFIDEQVYALKSPVSVGAVPPIRNYIFSMLSYSLWSYMITITSSYSSSDNSTGIGSWSSNRFGKNSHHCVVSLILQSALLKSAVRQFVSTFNKASF